MTDRKKVNVRVPSQVKDAYESRIIDEHVQKRPYAGVILERELKIQFEIGGISALYDAFPTHSQNSDEKENNSMPSSGESVLVQYRIDPSVRAELMTLSDPGSMVARIMWRYSLDDGFVDMMVRAVRNDEYGEYEQLSATERRKEQIKDWLLDRFGDGEQITQQFGFDDFDTAAKEAADLQTRSHARENYLRDVAADLNISIDKTGFTQTQADAVPTIPKPREVPFRLLNSDEKLKAVKREVKDMKDERKWWVSDRDLQTMFIGSVSISNVRELMMKVEQECNDVKLKQEKDGTVKVAWKPYVDDGDLSTGPGTVKSHSENVIGN